jgi:hypothetical protein
MTPLLILLCAVCWTVLALTWLGYPLWLEVRTRRGPRAGSPGAHARWPSVTVVVVVHNVEPSLRVLLENLTSLAYPRELRRILVVSNDSTDFTDAVARRFAHRGVELLRIMPPRRQAAIAENLARRHVMDEVVVVLRPDARLRPAALAALVAPFADPTVGVAYGRETSAELTEQGARVQRSLYIRYEAWLRGRETAVFGTVSARASLYAMRGELFRHPVSATLSPDFAPILIGRERGFRAVYAPDAECVVVRHRSIRGQYGRTVRAVARDVATLFSRPHLLDPRRYGEFAWLLLGHKLGRWLTPWALLGGVAGALMLLPTHTLESLSLVAAFALGADAVVAWQIPQTAAGRMAALPARFAASSVAIAHALVMGLKQGPELQPETVRTHWFPNVST